MKSWTFDSKEIVGKFDSHVREQLPWYEMVTEAVTFIVRNYLTPNNNIVDIGCSTGNMIDKLFALTKERDCYIIGYEKSKSMFQHCDEKYNMCHTIEIEHQDIIDVEMPRAQVYILFLTLMFIPVDERPTILKRIKENCVEGGIIIIVDKINDHEGYFSTVLKRLTWHFKILQGANPKDIVEKEMELCGIQIPIDIKLVKGGKEFFRMGDFAGWVIEC